MNRRSSVFLMEIMAAVLFFSLASALCLGIFAKSRRLSDDTQNLYIAANQAQNAMELMRHAVSPDASGQTAEDTFFPSCILPEYPDAKINGDTLLIYYDSNWNHCAEESGLFCMEITPQTADQSGLFCYHIETVSTDKHRDSIYSFDFMLHIPNRP